jgi:hypothetical protein
MDTKTLCSVHLHEGIDVILRNITLNRRQRVLALELLPTAASELLVALVMLRLPQCLSSKESNCVVPVVATALHAGRAARVVGSE